MKTLTISWVGKPEIKKTQWGEKQKFSIKAKEEGDKFIDVWLKPDAAIWKVGENHEVEDVKPREYNGKTYYSVVFPKNGNGKTDPALIGKIILNLGNIERKVDMIIAHLSKTKRLDLTSAGTPVPFNDDEEEKSLEELASQVL